MKKHLLGLILLLFSAFTANKATAQSVPNFNTSLNINCLTVKGEAGGKYTWDSCATVEWFLNIPGTNTYTSIFKGRFLNTTIKAGTYNLCAKLVNTCTKFDTVICKSITIKACNCTLESSFTYTVDCKKVKFLAKSNLTGTTYTWNFGDNSDAKGTDPTHTYLKEGIYKVCLTAIWKDSTGSACTTTVCKEINVTCGKPCELKGDFTFGSGRNGEMRFLASSNTGFYYTWNFGDGTTAKGKDPIHKFTKAGVYTVCVTIVDKLEKCKITICKKVEIGNPCKLTGNFTFKQVNDSTFSFLASASTTSTYLWNWGDGTTSTGKDPRKIYSKPGTYTVCVKIYSITSKCFIYVCKKIEVKAAINKTPCVWPSNITIGYSNTCNKYFFELTNLSNVDSCITYSLGLYNMKTGKLEPLASVRTASATIADTGSYAIIGKYMNKCTGCDTQVYKIFKVTCTPTTTPCNWSKASFGYGNKCNIYTFEAANLGIAPCWKYQFKVGNSTGSTTLLPAGRVATYEFKSTGYYQVCAKFLDSCNKCDTWVCKTIYVDCTPCAATAGFTVDSVATNGRMYLKNTSTKSGSYLWSFGDSTFSKDKTPSHTYAASGVYTVCLTTYDSTGKCSSTYCYTVKVVKSRMKTSSNAVNTIEEKVYPNPAQSGFWIETGNTEYYEYQVFNLTGSMIRNGASNDKLWINTNDWAEGIYQIKVIHNNGELNTHSILVNKR